MSSKQRNKAFTGLQSLQALQPGKTSEETLDSVDESETGDSAEIVDQDSVAEPERSADVDTPEPVKAEVLATPVKPAPEVVKPQSPQPVTNQTRHMKTTTDELTGYLDAMNPTKPMKDTEGAKWQKFLLDVMVRILEQQDQSVFNEKWTALLSFFHKNKTNLFNPNYAYRFMHKWTGSESEVNAFRMLVWVAMETSDLTKRKEAMTKIRMDKIMGLTVDQRNRLVSFYS